MVETCSTGGMTSYAVAGGDCDPGAPPQPCLPQGAVPADPCRQYFFVVPVNSEAGLEGSPGFDSDGLPRSPGRESCFPQGLAECAMLMP